MVDIVEIVRVYRYIFLFSSFLSFIILFYRAKRNRENRGFVYPALVYFFCVFIFYLFRMLSIPVDPNLANLISNIIRTLGEITIFFITYLLLGSKSHE